MTILMIGVCGCNLGTNNNPSSENTQNTEDNVILSERQIKILSDQGLSTDYNKLETNQKEAIVAIEELLKHLEDKYEIGFTYLGYNAEGVLEDEKLTAYPSDGDELIDIVTATRKGGEITDNYINIAIRPIYNDIIVNYMKQTFSDEDFRVFSSVNNSNITELPITAADISCNVAASNMIFFDSKNINDSEFDAFREAFIDWMKGNKYFGSNQLILLESGLVEYLSPYNYSDHLGGDQYSRRVSFSINYDGEVNMWE